MINLRGSIVTVIDLGYCLGYGKTEIRKDSTHCLITKSREEISELEFDKDDSDEYLSEPIGLLVDYIGDILTVEQGKTEPPPPNLDKIQIDFIKNVVKLKNEIVVQLDLVEILKGQSQAESGS